MHTGNRNRTLSKEQESLRKEKKKLGVIADEGQPLKKSKKG